MKSALKIFIYLSAFNSVILFMRSKDYALNILLWFPKMIAAALTPVSGVFGLLGMLVGLMKRDSRLTFAGFLGAVLSARFIEGIPDGNHQFTSVFAREIKSVPSHTSDDVDFKTNLVIGHNPKSGKPLVADLWKPHPGSPQSGIGIIYSHGSGWRVGDKDMLTRPFFRRLAKQGHVVLDIAYSLYPEADLPTMVSEVILAIMWMKENSQAFQVNPERIVLMGGSAGAHLSLLAAYAPHQPEFQPGAEGVDMSVRGVVAYYPPTDLREIFTRTQHQYPPQPRLVDSLANKLFNRIFELHQDPAIHKGSEYENYLVNILGGTPEEIPEVYELLSPITHVSKDCPPTLLLQGSDDVFELAAPVRSLHKSLQKAGVPAILIEYPYTEHGFDLILPQLSPVAQAATREVERFLCIMAQ